MTLDTTLVASFEGASTVVVVTGAGVSAASGIPTFRGHGGYWTVGSVAYRPEELATHAAFSRMPQEVWHWYLYRRTVCRGAEPNAAHRALARLEQAFGDGFTLVSQNVDGLHLRAGNTRPRTFEIHGNIDYMRCETIDCDDTPVAIPNAVGSVERNTVISDDTWPRLTCAQCGAPTRPHVLWFDEYYDERLFRSESSLRAAARADVIITAGTSGTTNLPHQIVAVGRSAGALIVDVNPEDNPFGAAADFQVLATATDALPAIADALAS